jgi:ferredoxin
MKVIIDEEKCVGGGQCVMAAPNVFDQRDSDGIVVLLDATPPEAESANTREAAILCPATAIRIEERPSVP